MRARPWSYFIRERHRNSTLRGSSIKRDKFTSTQDIFPAGLRAAIAERYPPTHMSVTHDETLFRPELRYSFNRRTYSRENRNSLSNRRIMQYTYRVIGTIVYHLYNRWSSPLNVLIYQRKFLQMKLAINNTSCIPVHRIQSQSKTL